MQNFLKQKVADKSDMRDYGPTVKKSHQKQDLMHQLQEILYQKLTTLKVWNLACK